MCAWFRYELLSASLIDYLKSLGIPSLRIYVNTTLSPYTQRPNDSF
jgi:hypothetical protein